MRIWLALICFAAAIEGSRTFAERPDPNRSSRILVALQDRSSTNILIAAHRGGYERDKKDKAPENSVANIRNCSNKGYSLYETDIQRTKDGHFVIVHDRTIERETNGTGSVSDLPLAELKQLRKRYRDRSLADERVATLVEFLEAGKGRTIFKADLKPGVSRHFKEIMQLVMKHNASNGIIFRVPYRQADEFAKFRGEGVPLAPHTLMFMVSSKKQVDEIKARFGSTTLQINLDRSDPTRQASLDLIRYATNIGFAVETHAEGEAEDWKKLIDSGVRMFHTKVPSKLKSFLESLPE